MKLERNADEFGREFWACIFWEDLKSWKNKAEKFAEKFCHQNSLRNSPGIFLKLARPKKNSPQIRSPEPGLNNLPQIFSASLLLKGKREENLQNSS